MNCEIMSHKENNNKKSASSITYDELINMVNAFDLKNSPSRFRPSNCKLTACRDTISPMRND